MVSFDALTELAVCVLVIFRGYGYRQKKMAIFEKANYLFILPVLKTPFLQCCLLLLLMLVHQAPDFAAAYREQLQVLACERAQMQQAYLAKATDAEKKQLTDAARNRLYSALIDRLFPFWYGTPWDYNGTTQTPQKGKIACGYFVTTLLRHAGFDLERVKLAQQSSEKIIRTLVSEKYIVRLNKITMEDFVSASRAMGNGLYLVGLDTHIGFLLVQDNELRFIHAAYSAEGMVKSEPVWQCKVLMKSKFRVVGKLLSDEKTIEGWLLNNKFTTVL